MGIKENKAIVKQFVESFGKGDSSVIDELTTDDFVFHALRHGGGDTDKNFLKQTLASRAFADNKETIVDMIAEGDRVICLSTATGTHTGEFHGIPPTGNAISICRFWSFRIQNGKIADVWAFEDSLGRYQQLGVLPALPEFVKAYKDSLK